MKKMSTGFKVTVSALLAILVILSIAIAGLFYWQNAKSNEEQRKLKKQIAAFEKTITNLKKGGMSGTETGTTVTEDKYKGWQTYTNQTYKITARYPAGWTYEETQGSSHVTFLGPETTGVITRECAFSIFVEDVAPGTSLNNYVDTALNEPMGKGTVVEEGATTIAGNAAFKVVDTYTDVGHKWQRLRVYTIKNNLAFTFQYSASTNYNGSDYYAMHLAKAELWLASISID